MRPVYSSNDTIIFDVSKGGLISIADDFWPPVPWPIRRIFSLMRLSQCKSILIEIQKSSKSNNVCDTLNCFSCYHASLNSCKEYISFISSINKGFKYKVCYRVSFFKNILSSVDDIKYQNSLNFLGYCIIQSDVFEDTNEYNRTYVTESAINYQFKDNRHVIYGLYPFNINIKGQSFRFLGNYFSQQNNITNCCANAAIKMVFRAYFPELTASSINKALKIDNKIILCAHRGIYDIEICKVINKIFKQEVYLLNSFDCSDYDFIKTIYHAIESRLPVILVFRLTNKKSHSVAIIGHTFNKHIWLAYSFKEYFSSKKEEIDYLSSFLWCDNFIISDDNLGPYYYIPIQMLPKKIKQYGKFKFFYKKYIDRIFYKNMHNMHKNIEKCEGVRAIITYRKDMEFFKFQVFSIEKTVAKLLHNYIEKIRNIGTISKSLDEYDLFRKYFLKYFKEKNLIYRTYILSKKEYLDNIDEVAVPFDTKKLGNLLPDMFWITEISIPEVFWINQAKVGEILVDPKIYNTSKRYSAMLIRLPNIMSIFDSDSVETYIYYQTKPHQPLIRGKCYLAESDVI